MITDDEIKGFWEAETNAPRWFRDANSNKHFSLEEFREWCAAFWRVYPLADRNAALFVRRTGDLAEIHFNARPGCDAARLTEELGDVKRDILASGINTVIGWVAKPNRGLRRICEAMGMRDYGFHRFEGETHGRVIEWCCYHLHAERKLIAPPFANVLSLR